MSGSAEQERLQAEIEELRGELGETVEALAHKADIPARAKERGQELKEQAVERGQELREQAVERGSELKDQALERGSELKDQAVAVGGQARQEATRIAADRWPALVGAGVALIALLVVVRRVRAR